jgi:hypothetical protein
LTATSRFERERAHKAVAGLRGLGQDARADEIAALIHADGDVAYARLLAKTARAEAEIEMRGRKAVWDVAYMNSLPDSAFLYVAPGGTKDSDGKTVPRSLRSFPYKDAQGNVDMPHLRNALSRIPQSNLPAAVKDRCTQTAQRILDQQSKAVKQDAPPSMSGMGSMSSMSDDKLLAMIKMMMASDDTEDAQLQEMIAEAKKRGLDVPEDADNDND